LNAYARKPFARESKELDIVSACSEALEHTVTANFMSWRHIYYEHPLEFLGHKPCTVRRVRPEEKFMLRLEYNGPLEIRHCIKVIKRLREGELKECPTQNGSKLQNTY